MNWLRAKRANSVGVVDGLNDNAKWTTRKSNDFFTDEANETALSHNICDIRATTPTATFL